MMPWRRWRVHAARDKRGQIIRGSWDWCQQAECGEDHRLYQPFRGVGPVTGRWEGVKHAASR